MERWTNRAPRSLREMPLLVLAGVAFFVIWAVVLAGLLLRDDDPDDLAGLVTGEPEATATATASPTPPATVPGAATQPSTTPLAIVTAVTPPPAATVVGVTAVTSAPEPTPPAEPQPATQPAQGDSPAAIALLDLLPTLDDLPDGFVVTDEGTLALDELAGIHPDPDMQRERLRGWGFTAAAERRFNVPSGSGEPVERMTLLTVIAVEFRAAVDTRAAVEANHADALIADGAEISAVEIEPLGDFSRAASGTLDFDGESLRVAYVTVQIGNYTITFAGGSPTQDPLAEVVEVASRTLYSLPSGGR